jgi:hypothetical protein
VLFIAHPFWEKGSMRERMSKTGTVRGVSRPSGDFGVSLEKLA